MREFTDSKGRKWAIEVHPLNMRRVRELTGVNIGTLLNDEMKGLRELLTDPVKFADVVCVMVRDQMSAIGVTDEQFGAALGGDAIEQAAEAFWGALVDFSPRQAREPLTALAKKTEELHTAAAKLSVSKIEAINTEAILQEMLTSKETVGGSPVSSESIPLG